jgi:hypothetical protein
MAFARVVSFDDVTRERIGELQRQINEGERPDDIPASEFVVLYDPDEQSSLAILFFDTEEDYARGHATLDAMPADDTPGQRTSIRKYEVAVKRDG